jgi:hypothetical protein
MGSRGESEHADAVRIDVPFSGMGSHDAEGALCVLKCCG